MCVCVCASVCVCMYVCVCVHVRGWVCACVHVIIIVVTIIIVVVVITIIVSIGVIIAVVAELTDVMLKEIKAALASGSPNEVLSEGFRLRLTRADIGTLRGLNWLNDEVVSIVTGVIVLLTVTGKYVCLCVCVYVCLCVCVCDLCVFHAC